MPAMMFAVPMMVVVSVIVILVAMPAVRRPSPEPSAPAFSM
jgi:hypothetical protein